MPSAEKLAKKQIYFDKLIRLLETEPTCLLVNVDHVGSKQLQNIRIVLRGKATILMGKNTMIRTALRKRFEETGDEGLERLINVMKGNLGFIFCKAGTVDFVRDIMAQNVLPAAAKVGVEAPVDVHIPAGPCGLDPAQTSFFQALNIATKIVKGAIEIVNETHLIKKGETCGASAVALLQKLATYQALNLLLFLLDTHQCQRWAKARRASLSARIHDLTSFANKDDKRVERLVRQHASTALVRFEDIMRAFDEETEDEEIRESDFPLHDLVSPIAPRSISDEPKDRESIGETREDQMLLDMLEEEAWPPPSWNDPVVIGSAPENSSNGISKSLQSLSAFSQLSPEARVNSRRVEVSSWRRTLKLWCCCLTNLIPRY